jgi:tRNA A-37 threonylcarbamoyl transferase component Bud32
VRFIFRPPAAEAAGLLSLPWGEPLEQWRDDRLLEVAQRGISRHVVRFVEVDGRVYALKEIDERLARKEYRLLGELEAMGMPAVSVLGVCVERPEHPEHPDVLQDAILVTRFLDYSMSYRYVFSAGHTTRPTDQLVDAMVELLARLHLAGLYWGDCSLSNTLFRPDAGSVAAHLVDAETAELYPALTDGQRATDLAYAFERVGGELFDLQAGGYLPDDVDPIEVAQELPRRYEALWDELTREELFRPDEQRYRVAERIDRLNELGFDVDEIELITTAEGTRLKVHTQVAEVGRHRHRLFALTGLEVTENQARRLLNDLLSYRGYLEQKEGRAVPETVAAHRWRSEVFDRILALVPEELADRLPPAEIFHEILEHRWFLSEQAGKDVGTTAAAKSYVAKILPRTPSTLTVLPVAVGGEVDTAAAGGEIDAADAPAE